MVEIIVGKIIRSTYINGRVQIKSHIKGRACLIPSFEEILLKFKSLSYFFSNDYNNSLFKEIKTSEVVLADYIFKNNSMKKISVDLSNCYSAIGGFNGSNVETVVFENGTPNLQKANDLFRSCGKLTLITGLSLKKCDSVKYMFANCKSLTSDLLIETVATDLSYMFYNCKKVAKITLIAPNLKIATGTFTGCDNLANIVIDAETNFEILFSSLQNTINGIITVNSGTVPEEVKKIATDKGWTVK